MLQEGRIPAFIATSLGRHRSSITRELTRNGWKATPAVRSSSRWWLLLQPSQHTRGKAGTYATRSA